MGRHYKDWITAYQQFCTYTEAPAHMHYWAAISTIAGALGRKSWLDFGLYKWYPNQYILLLARPGVVSKSTTMSIGMDMLFEVDPTLRGPTSCTWPALLQWLEKHSIDMVVDGVPSSIQHGTCSISEFGTFLKKDDDDMQNILIDLWDGKRIDKQLIKTNGSVLLVNPLLNMNGCTTPAWVEQNISQLTMEGGLISRIHFIIGDEKAKEIAYPDEFLPPDYREKRQLLIDDLREIWTLQGEFKMTTEARNFGRAWYSDYQRAEKGNDSSVRRQIHVHKMAMALCASRSNDMLITKDDLEKAIHVITLVEKDKARVRSSVGRHKDAPLCDEIVHYVARSQGVEMQCIMKEFLPKLPNKVELERLLMTTVAAGRLVRKDQPGNYVFFQTPPTDLST